MVKNFVVIALMLAFSLLGGLLATTGSVKIIGAFAGLFLAIFLLTTPTLLFGVVLVFSLVISGVAEFYLGVGQANWVASILALGLVASAFISSLKHSSQSVTRSSKSVGWLVAAYVTVLILASLLNVNSVMQIIVGMRNYIPFIGVFLALQFFGNSDKELKRSINLILLIGLIQLPFCLQQAIFVAPARQHSLEAVGGGAEAIVGTFGGNPLGGGYTGEMAVFMLLVSCLVLALAASLRFGKSLSFAICIGAIGCVALAETKIVFLLTPLALILVFLEDIRSSPKKMFAMLIAVICVLGGLAAVYAWRFWAKGPDEFWHAFTYSFDPNFMVDRLHRGRIGALVHWWDSNVVRFDAMHALLGYGMGSTLEASRTLGEGSAVIIYGLGIDAHAANKLLWDSGMLGFGFFCWIIVRTGLNANRLVRGSAVPQFHLGVLKASRAAMFCFAAMLPYQVSVLGGAPMQFLFWFFIGYVEYWRRQAPRIKND